ncbi:MAG: class I SAM-dependent methyltransferase [bacterium]|nr:class I SAM-dependent methyltransferase [bacterium]
MTDRKTGYTTSDAVAKYINERNHFGWRLRGERAVKFAEIKKGDFVLDLCCGPGMVTKVISEVVGLDGKVVGVDISDEFIKYARELCHEENTSFIVGGVEDLSMLVGDRKFDSVVLLASWFWIKNTEKLSTGVKNCLKPDGRFVISLSSDNLNDSKTREFYWTYRENLKETVSNISPSTDLSYFDNLPVMDNSFINGVVSQVAGCGFCLQSQNEVERQLTLEEKLFIYNNPARTEWVGEFPPGKRLQIIKQALRKTASEVGDSIVIKRHTYYLVFGLDESA